MSAPKQEEDPITKRFPEEYDQARNFIELKVEIGKHKENGKGIIALMEQIKETADATKATVERIENRLTSLVSKMDREENFMDSSGDIVSETLWSTCENLDEDYDEDDFDNATPGGYNGIKQIAKLANLAAQLLKEQRLARKKMANVSGLYV
ncbi:hypothetical protein BC567DRAFT_258988 [Phyllosticta citribraziliensis]